jgi:hypothetical protein
MPLGLDVKKIWRMVHGACFYLVALSFSSFKRQNEPDVLGH